MSSWSQRNLCRHCFLYGNWNIRWHLAAYQPLSSVGYNQERLSGFVDCEAAEMFLHLLQWQESLEHPDLRWRPSGLSQWNEVLTTSGCKSLTSCLITMLFTGLYQCHGSFWGTCTWLLLMQSVVSCPKWTTSESFMMWVSARNTYKYLDLHHCSCCRFSLEEVLLDMSSSRMLFLLWTHSFSWVDS